MKIAVLASHEGTTLQAVVDACAAKAIPCQVVAIISNNRDSGALERARATSIRGYHLSSHTNPDAADLDAAMCRALVECDVDVILLAGYMKQIGPETLSRFRGRILNTHPALLPKFGGKGMYGLHVHRAVLAAGESKSGASVHVVSEAYDAGPVLAQVDVRVEPTDTPATLAERVQERERSLVVETLGAIAAGRIRLPAAGEEGRPTTPLPDAIVAVVLSGPFVLMIRRGPSGPDPGYWAPPSGKVEPGERQEAAVIREVKEEVGVTIRPVRKVWESVSAGGTHTLHWWLADAADHDLRPNRREVSDARWVTVQEIATLKPTFPGDRHFFEEVFHRA